MVSRPFTRTQNRNTLYYQVTIKLEDIFAADALRGVWVAIELSDHRTTRAASVDRIVPERVMCLETLELSV